MFCPNCGAQLNEGQAFCTSCGAMVENQAAGMTHNPAQPLQAPTDLPYKYGQFTEQQGRTPMGQSVRFVHQSVVIPMKWYKFLIHFMLFASAIVNIVLGLMALTGAQYITGVQSVAPIVYKVYPGLKAIDIIYGIAIIALAAFQLHTRTVLASYKANAPKYITVMYIATAAINTIYGFSVIAVVPSEIISSSQMIEQAVGAVVGAVVMVILNKTYFDKRKYLFVN